MNRYRIKAAIVLGLSLGVSIGANARTLPEGYREEILIAGWGVKVERIKNKFNEYKIHLKQPNAKGGGDFSWIFYDADKGIDLDDGGQGETSEGALLGDAWGAMFGKKRGVAMLTVASDPARPRTWALSLARPVWHQDKQEWLFSAKLLHRLSPNLKRSYPGARLRHSLPVGDIAGLASVIIDNRSHIAHNQLAAAIASTSLGDTKAPDCTLHQMSVEGVRAYVEYRPDIQRAKGWSGALSTADKDAIAKSVTLPCEPKLDLTKPDTLPANVKAITSYLTEDKWQELTAYAGKGDESYKLPFDRAGFSYINFLKAVARHPYFCGETGSYTSLDEACKRELAAVFAHAAQETGAHEGSDQWKQAFNFMRESGCWNIANGCGINYAPYAGDCPAPFVCPKDAAGYNQYWGRGIKQLSHYYNYAQFSAGWYGSENFNLLLSVPDQVAANSSVALGSGVWFYMSPQQPKPSMHDVIIGTYHPKAEAENVKIDADGSVLDKFEASVSLINGSFECSPAAAETLQKSKNRFTYYKALLQYFDAQLTPVEAGYVPNESYCKITRGDAFSNPNLATTVNLQYERLSRHDDGSCVVVSYGIGLPLQVAPEGMGEICKQLPNK